MGNTAPGSEDSPVVARDPVRVCPPDWDLTPGEYAQLAHAESSTWRGRPVAVASALCAALFGALALYANSVPFGVLAGLCLVVSMWIGSFATRMHRALVEMPGDQTIDLSGNTPPQRDAIDAVLAGVPSRRSAARSLTAYAAREQGLANLWRLATKIDQARAHGEVLADADLARLTPAPQPSKPRAPFWRQLLAAPTVQPSLPSTDTQASPAADPTGGTSAAAHVNPLQVRWAAAIARYESVMADWGAIASDPLAALEHAALLDVSQPRTATFIGALGRAQDRHAILGTTVPVDPQDVHEFEDLSRAVFTAWREAKRHAAHVGYSWLPDAQRKHAERAERFLRVACDQGASLAERATAAEQAAKVLRRIHDVVLPEPALEVVAATMRLQLEAGSAMSGKPILDPEPERTADDH